MVEDGRSGRSGGYDFSTMNKARAAGPGQLPPPPPFANAGMYPGAPGMFPGILGMYPPVPGMYPGMPGMMPPMYNAMMSPQSTEPKKSRLPLVGFIMSLVAMLPSLIIFSAMLLLVIEVGVNMGLTSEGCCLSLAFFWLLSLVFSTLGIIFGAVAYWGVKTRRYLPTWMAPTGMVLGIVSGALFIGTHIMFFVRMAMEI